MVKKLKILTLALLSTLLASAQCENDTINPWFVDFEYEITIQCSDFINNAMPITDDNCDHDIEIGVLEDVIHGDCEGTQTIYRIYRAYDDAGNQATETQIIHVVDEVPPTITGEIYVEVQSDVDLNSTLFATAYDECSSASLYYTDMEVSGNSIIRIYTALDECGNASTFEQIIHIINNHVAICHQLGNGNFITIYVAPQAVNAHLTHGDYLGPCRTDGNQFLPYMNLERLPNGEFKKYVQCK